MSMLTDIFVAWVKEPGKYYDVYGLFLRVTPSGSKQWVLARDCAR